jgi:hypothetical protein
VSSSPSVSSSSASADNRGDTPARSLYQRFLATREDVLRHKWLKSEEAGEDVGFEAALVDWMENKIDESTEKNGES